MRKLLLSIAFGMVAFVAQAQPTDPAALLRHAIEAGPHLRYSGTLTVGVKMGVERRFHTELILKDGGRTRIEFPKDSPSHGQVIVETDRERRQYFPAQNLIRVQPPRREKAFQRLIRLANAPAGRRRLQISDGGNIAGQHTMLVSVAERLNKAQGLWIEPRSGAVLKMELYDATGTVKGGFEYTEVNFNPHVDERDFRLLVKGAKIVTPSDEVRETALRLHLINVMLSPDSGFQLDSVHTQKFGTEEAMVQHYSNEQKRVSFFQLHGNIDPERLQKFAKDLKTVSWQLNGATCVLMGELPVEQLQELSRRLGHV